MRKKLVMALVTTMSVFGGGVAYSGLRPEPVAAGDCRSCVGIWMFDGSNFTCVWGPPTSCYIRGCACVEEE